MSQEQLAGANSNKSENNVMDGVNDGETEIHIDFEDNLLPKRKSRDRHTPHQIHEMEAFFKECPHPNIMQIRELSREIGMEPLQVKFWFQNKRTQMKKNHERKENVKLRATNEMLRAENMRYIDAIRNSACPACGGPIVVGATSFEENYLRMENARLREEIGRILEIGSNYVGKPFPSFSSTSDMTNLAVDGDKSASASPSKLP